MKIIKLLCLVIVSLLMLQSISFAGKGGGSPAPKYYTYEDLKDEAQNSSWSFSFDGSNQPAEAEALLPEHTAESWWARARYSWWAFVQYVQSSEEIDFPWEEVKAHLKQGDLIFLRSGGVAGYIVRFISAWTHVAIVWDPWNEETFEALKLRGVDIYKSSENMWDHIVSYSVKRFKNLSDYIINLAMENAKNNYRHKPYFPSVKDTIMDREGFFSKWSDKNDMDSLYCSKLVYHTFMYVGKDLDTNRTRSHIYRATDYDYNGNKIDDAWIGVSPDDIYYSTCLDNDLYLVGEGNLSRLLPEWMF